MKRFNITVNGNSYDVQVEELAPTAEATMPAAVQVATVPAVVAPATPAAPPVSPAPAAVSGSEEIFAPMPGTIVNVIVKSGDSVKQGEAMLVLEAMKMENEIMSPRDAVIAGIHVNKGDSVNSGQLIITLV